MLLARPIGCGRPGELGLAARRMGLEPQRLSPAAAVSLLLTGLEPGQGQLLGAVAGLGFEAGQAPGTGLLWGPRHRLAEFAQQASQPLGAALLAALRADEPPPALQIGKRRFEFGARTYLMGIINVTPDSFSDAGCFLDPSDAIAQGEALARAGADLLDVGGESTRPGAVRVGAQEELARVLPVIRGLAERTELPISVDTSKAEVAREALAAGASLVNDVTAFGFDPTLAQVVASSGAACCLMHMQGTPASMQTSPRYLDLSAEVIEFLALALERCDLAGIPREKVMVDPGIGFGKSFEHNLYLLRRLGELRVLGRPVLVGASRKAFLGKLTGGKPATQRAGATAALAAAVAAGFGADFQRVHDVSQVKEALAVAQAIREAEDGGELFAKVAGPTPAA